MRPVRFSFSIDYLTTSLTPTLLCKQSITTPKFVVCCTEGRLRITGGKASLETQIGGGKSIEANIGVRGEYDHRPLWAPLNPIFHF
jgi:hypothetical protein